MSGITVNVHTASNSMDKIWIFSFLPFWTIFTIKDVRRIQIQLDRRMLLTMELNRPTKSKVLRLSKLQRYFSFKTPSFRQFSMAVARCCNGWNLNTSSLRNARRVGLETSSCGIPSNILWDQHFLHKADYIVTAGNKGNMRHKFSKSTKMAETFTS